MKTLPIYFAALLIFVSCSRGQGELHAILALTTELPFAHEFESYDLDALDKAYGEENGSSYSKLSSFLNLSSDTEENLQAIFPKGSRGIVSKVGGPYFPDPDFVIWKPNTFDAESFQELLASQSYLRVEESESVFWVEESAVLGPIAWTVSNGKIYSGALNAVHVILSKGVTSKELLSNHETVEITNSLLDPETLLVKIDAKPNPTFPGETLFGSSTPIQGRVFLLTQEYTSEGLVGFQDYIFYESVKMAREIYRAHQLADLSKEGELEVSHTDNYILFDHLPN